MNRQGIIKQLFSCYPNTMIQPETVAMYDRLLADIPDEILQTVVDRAISESKFLPTIAEIRDSAYDTMHPDKLSWVEAWDNVCTQMRKVGYIGTPSFSSDITAQVVKSMGWRALCASENPDIVRAQFRDMFNAVQKRQETDAKLLPEVKALRRIITQNGMRQLEG